MPYFDDAVDKSYTTDFGNGQTLTIQLRDNYDAAPLVKEFIRRSSAATGAEKHINALIEKRDRCENQEEFLRFEAQIEDWSEKVPDMVEVLTNLIERTGVSWDRFASKADMEAGRPLPFTREKIAEFGLKPLGKIANALMEKLGFGQEEISDPKARSADSQEPSTGAHLVQ